MFDLVNSLFLKINKINQSNTEVKFEPNNFYYLPKIKTIIFSVIVDNFSKILCSCLVKSKTLRLYKIINDSFNSRLDVKSLIFHQQYINKIFEILLNSKQIENVDRIIFENIINQKIKLQKLFRSS